LNRDNREREINGLLEAMKKFKLKEGLILTYNQEDQFDIDNLVIRAIPLWKWLIK
jgi:predicted AAA+ superfamily ATPase